MADIAKNNKDAAPYIHILRAVHELTKKAIPYQQTLLYSQNLIPEHLECVYKTKLLITKTYSIAHNIAALYNESGGIAPLKLANYNIEFFLSTVINRVKTLYDNRNIEIDINCSAECKNVILDIRRTSLILFNLISNAVIHSGVKNKVISVSARIEDQSFILSVRDNGKGVPKGKRKNLFCAYQDRMTLPMIEETSGGLFNSGTGLAVSLKAADEMNGTLSYVPSSQGAVFQLVIPQDKMNLSLGEPINYSPSDSDLEEYLARSLLMLLAEDEEN